MTQSINKNDELNFVKFYDSGKTTISIKMWKLRLFKMYIKFSTDFESYYFKTQNNQGNHK